MFKKVTIKMYRREVEFKFMFKILKSELSMLFVMVRGEVESSMTYNFDAIAFVTQRIVGKKNLRNKNEGRFENDA